MRRLLLSFVLLALTVNLAPAAHAQDNSSAQPASPATQTPAQAQPAQTAPKRVWTNEDVPDLRADSTISTVGNSHSSQAGRRQTNTGGRGQQKDPSWYRNEILRLQKELPPINEKIDQLQSALDGNFTGDSKTSSRPTGVQGGDWRMQLEQLQKKRDDIEANINMLRDEARHAGVPPNTLP
ncbi:MAG TPA: hypothetical protein VEJ38_16860 [Candidatus Acidoferrales bacterium]|nr:hypothetical protein [Candidatus Acidoferrales bacterium]